MQLICIAVVAACVMPGVLSAQEPATFITYTHQMEEPGNLEIENHSATGAPGGGNRFFATATEFEYGLRGWWTTEFYLDGQATAQDSAVFTGFRWENRFHLVSGEHWINPVLYVEFEDTSGADKTLLEVVGNDSQSDLVASNADSREEKQRELETKLILGSYLKGWTIAENFIMEKNLAHEPFEFGYAVAVTRPLALAARPDECRFCAENFQAGVEAYGGLGTHKNFGLADTSHYLAPLLAWSLPSGVTLKLSPGFGLTGSSLPFLLRVGVSWEIEQIGRLLRGGR
ncbi:MAG: hypothetical protein ABSF98_28845 [Bryobacteraceae bacterium]